jgi:hypothetical protein
VAKIFLILMSIGLGLSLYCQKSKTNSVRSPAIAVAASSATQPPSPAPKKAVQAQQIEKTWASKFRFGTRSIRKKHTGVRSYEIDVEYPKIQNARTRGALKFNRWMKKKAMGYVSQFRHLQRNAERLDRLRKLPPLKLTESLKIWHDVYYSDDRLISLRLTHSVMAVGQMHPIDYYETINYNLSRGRPFSERDVFKKGYLNVLSSFSRKHVRDNYEMDYTTDEWLKEGTTPKRDNFPNWNVVPEGILISFEDYQIASHAFGQLELIVPYGELKGVLQGTALTNTFARSGSKLNQGRVRKG